MPDISMCQNQLCPLRETCYRFTATPDTPYQCYAVFKPDENGECDYYWPDEKIKQTT
jgi:hypothetical protein